MSPWLGHYHKVIMDMQLQVVPEGNPALKLKQLKGASLPGYVAWNPEVLSAILPQRGLRIAQTWKAEQELQGQGPGLEWPAFHSALFLPLRLEE